MKKFLQLSIFKQFLVTIVAFITAMIIFRVLYSGERRYIFLLWNIFLGWIPYHISTSLSKKELSIKSMLQFICWLIFFPNALYIITDLIHLDSESNIPLWYDATFLFTAALCGLLLAFAFLYKVEQFLSKVFSTKRVRVIIISCLFLGSFGVYVGRFLRWNSWDVVTDPSKLAGGIFARIVSPVEYFHTWAFTILFTCLFTMFYFFIKLFADKRLQSGTFS